MLLVSIHSECVNEDKDLGSRTLRFGRKFLSLALIFNSLLSMVYAVGLLTGYHMYGWTLYPPYLFNGVFFWVLIIASIVNIFPAATIGQVKIGRLWFHHYVYGLFVSGVSAISVLIFTSVPLLHLFTITTNNPTVNVCRFFLLGGLTLVLDDLPDLSKRLDNFLSLLKSKAYQHRNIIHLFQYVVGVVCFYLFAAVLCYITQRPQEATSANIILSATLLVTWLVSFSNAVKKVWLHITAEHNSS